MYKTRIQDTGHRAQKGFTLIEFMVAMSLISILSTMAIGNFMGSQKRGRDVRRQSDLNQYRVALENYSTNNQGGYPVATGEQDLLFLSLVPNYLPTILKDSGGQTYYYFGDVSNYVLYTCTEVQKTAYEICSNGKSGITTKPCNDTTSLNNTTCDL